MNEANQNLMVGAPDNAPMQDAEIVLAPEQPRIYRKTDLVLHCGAAKVDREDLKQIATPQATPSWTPIDHLDLVEQVELALRNANLNVVNQTHSLTKNGDRYFGMMQIANGTENKDYSWVLGLRNTHDKSFSAGIVAGMSVFVCDNLSFSGEVSMFRKHTTFILRDLPYVTERAIGRLMERWHHQDQRIEAYKTSDLTDTAAHDLLIKALDVRAIVPTRLPAVLKEWRNPSHKEFEPRTLWSLFNCFTEALKASSLGELPNRTQALHGLFDGFAQVPMIGEHNSAN